MFSNLILGLTVFSYIALFLFNLNRFEGTSDQLAGTYFIGFIILVAYVVCSLLLTINVTANGGFDWVAKTILWRNVGVGVLWMGMVAGVVVSMMTKSAVSFGDELSGVERLVGWLLYNGAIWLPLLMLLPYISILHPEWRFALAPQVVNISLLMGCAIGLITFATQSKVRPWLGAKSDDYEINKILRKINQEKSVYTPLYYIGDKDIRLKEAALKKIRQQKNLEAEFLTIFENNNVHSIGMIYLYWNENKVEHPDRFIQAINNSLPSIISETQEAMGSSYKPSLPLNIEVMCSVLDQQFNKGSAAFRPGMLRLQEVLAKNPPKRDAGDQAEFDTSLNNSRVAMNNWLDAN